MAKTRGVFALITRGNELLLSERNDGKGWNLPGGRVEEGESDQTALVREVKEETGLDVEVLHRVGPDHVFNDDTAVAYACKVIEGELKLTGEAKNHAWVNAQELRQGYFYNPEYDEMGNRTFLNEQRFDIKLIGPEGRLGRMGRMVWDAFSLIQEPAQVLRPGYYPGLIGPGADVMRASSSPVAHENNFYQLVKDELGEAIKIWPRIDPYSPTGFMQAK